MAMKYFGTGKAADSVDKAKTFRVTSESIGAWWTPQNMRVVFFLKKDMPIHSDYGIDERNYVQPVLEQYTDEQVANSKSKLDVVEARIDNSTERVPNYTLIQKWAITAFDKGQDSAMQDGCELFTIKASGESTNKVIASKADFAAKVEKLKNCRDNASILLCRQIYQQERSICADQGFCFG